MDTQFKMEDLLVENPMIVTLLFQQYQDTFSASSRIHSDFKTYILIEINNVTVKQANVVEHCFQYAGRDQFRKVYNILNNNMYSGIEPYFFSNSRNAWVESLEESNRQYIFKDRSCYMLFLNRSEIGMTIPEYNNMDQKDLLRKYEDEIKNFIFEYLVEYKSRRYLNTFIHKEFIKEFFNHYLRASDSEIRKIFNINSSEKLGITNITLPGADKYTHFVNDQISGIISMSNINYEQQETKLSDYILDNVKDLTELINENSEIVFDPNHGLDQEVKDFGDYLNYKRSFKLFDNQKNIINAFTRYFKKERAGFLISQPGSGKTSMAISISNLWKPDKNKNIFVLCPPHLNKKWAMDISVLAQNAMVYECDSVEDYINKIEPEISKRNCTNFILVNPKLLKHSYGYQLDWDDTFLYHMYNLRKKNLLFADKIYAPNRDRVTRDKQYLPYHQYISTYKEKNEEHPDIKTIYRFGAAPKIIKTCYDNNKELDKLLSKAFTTFRHVSLYYNNGPILDRIINQSIGDKEINSNFVSLDWYLQRKGRHNVDFFIIDEMHLFLSDSMQGEGAQRIASCAKKVLGLTGTVFNGMVTNLFFMLRNFFPAKLKDLKGFYFNRNNLAASKTNFKNYYGNKEKVASPYSVDANRMRLEGSRVTETLNQRPSKINSIGYTYIDQDGSVRQDSTGFNEYKVKDIPGINPEIFTQVMSSCCIFMTMSDMSNELPEINESVISCELDSNIKNNYEKLLNEMKASDTPNLVKAQKINKIAGWLDHPCIIPDDHFNFRSCDGNNNKLDELLKIVNHHDNECVLVYTYYDKHSPINNEILQTLISNGIKANILTDSVAPAKRIDWFKKQKDNGVRVVIVNPKLIETGLDLLDFTTIVFYQLNSNFFTMRQASRRSYRLNQKNNISLYYLYYKGTVQENIISVMAERLKAVKILEGDFEDEGLEAMTNADKADSSDEIFNKMITNEEYVNDDTVLGLNKYAQKIEKLVDNTTFEVHKVSFVKKPMNKKKIDFKHVYINLQDKVTMYNVMKDPNEKIKLEISNF